MIYQWSKTYSNSNIQSKKERALHFGQFDHKHLFGRDIEIFMKELQFQIDMYVSFGEESVKNGVNHGEILYIAKKLN